MTIKAILAAPKYAMGMTRLIKHLGWTEVSNIDDADVMIFTGGADVDPSLYGEQRHHSTGSWPERDAAELADMQAFIEQGKRKVIGVCRGAQFLTVMTDGKLIQDVSDHAGMIHQMFTDDGLVVDVNSYHHQMCLPVGHQSQRLTALGWAVQQAKQLRGMPSGFVKGKHFLEPESFRIENEKLDALCFQYHPEFPTMPDDGMKWTVDTVNHWIGD